MCHHEHLSQHLLDEPTAMSLFNMQVSGVVSLLYLIHAKVEMSWSPTVQWLEVPQKSSIVYILEGGHHPPLCVLFKWLGIKSINLECRQEKAHLVVKLRESRDHLIRGAEVDVCAGRKWKAQTAVIQAIGRLQHEEVLGRVQDHQWITVYLIKR